MYKTSFSIEKSETIAENIKRMRASERLSQGDLACLAGVHKRDIDDIEREIPLRLETKLKILKILYAKNHLTR